MSNSDHSESDRLEENPYRSPEARSVVEPQTEWFISADEYRKQRGELAFLWCVLGPSILLVSFLWLQSSGLAMCAIVAVYGGTCGLCGIGALARHDPWMPIGVGLSALAALSCGGLFLLCLLNPSVRQPALFLFVPMFLIATQIRKAYRIAAWTPQHR